MSIEGQAKRRISMKEFESRMDRYLHYQCLPVTLYEAPQAYKPMQEIVENIQDRVGTLMCGNQFITLRQ